MSSRGIPCRPCREGREERGAGEWEGGERQVERREEQKIGTKNTNH